MRFDWIYDGDNKFLDLFLTKKLLGYLIELNKITHSWFFFFYLQSSDYILDTSLVVSANFFSII